MDRVAQKSQVVTGGSAVRVAYTLSLADGTEVDCATREEPFEFVVGDGSWIAGLEAVLLGMVVGERQHYLIAAEEAFGLPDPHQLHTMPRSAFAAAWAGERLEPGLVISFEAPSGDLVPATIVALREEEVDVDFNHPLAGRDLQFDVELLSVGGGDAD
jgi:FKBP-type peptidyl-prolyl cis-trans isomerase SlpA